MTRLLGPWSGRRRLAALGLTPASARSGYRWRSWIVEHRLRTSGLAAAVVGGAGLLVGGPVAAVILTSYTAIGVHATTAAMIRRRTDQANQEGLDALAGLAADLRAGRNALEVLPEAARALAGADPAGRLAAQVSSARRIADELGSPLADLLDRLDADARGRARLRRLVAAQAAGVRATAGLLGVLPVFGVSVGYAVGADSLRVLLHTPLGAVFTGASLALQLGGLAWVARLSRGIGQSW